MAALFGSRRRHDKLMPDDLPIRACLCYKLTFSEIKTLAEENSWRTVPEITAALGCGSGCGLCRPYLQKMLETGETSFALPDLPQLTELR